MLKHVLHDWPDEACLRILRTCHRAMAAGRRLLVIDAVLPPGNAPHFGKTLDVALMTVDGQERTSEEFATLLSAGGFRLTRVLPDTGLPLDRGGGRRVAAAYGAHTTRRTPLPSSAVPPARAVLRAAASADERS